MADKYVPIFFDWPEATRELKAQEKGRLIDAIVLYARGGDWSELLEGNERYVFPMFQLQIDRANNISSKRAEAGFAGGKQNQAKPSKPKQTEANRSKTPNEYNNEYEYEEENNTTPLPPPGEKAAAEALALDILPHMTPTQMQEFASYRKDLPDELIRHALDIAADNTRSWGYVKGILNRYIDENIRTLADAEAQETHWREKKRTGDASSKGKNPALDYQQREYRDEDYGENFFVDLSKYGEA